MLTLGSLAAAPWGSWEWSSGLTALEAGALGWVKGLRCH